MHDPEIQKKFGKKQEVNSIVQQAIDDINFQENKNGKLRVKSETQKYENTESEIDLKELYEIDS